MKQDFMFTSESVTEGHPDKLCDIISDAVVDHFLQQDPYSKVIAECALSTAIVFIAARFESRAIIDFSNVARQVISQIGYDQNAFNSKTCSIITSLREQPYDGQDFLMRRTFPMMILSASRPRTRLRSSALPATRPLPLCRSRSGLLTSFQGSLRQPDFKGRFHTLPLTARPR